MGKLIFGILTIVLVLVCGVAGACLTGGLVAALVAYFTTGVVTASVGTCVAFAVKSAVCVVGSLLGYIACATLTVQS